MVARGAAGAGGVRTSPGMHMVHVVWGWGGHVFTPCFLGQVPNYVAGDTRRHNSGKDAMYRLAPSCVGALSAWRPALVSQAD